MQSLGIQDRRIQGESEVAFRGAQQMSDSDVGESGGADRGGESSVTAGTAVVVEYSKMYHVTGHLRVTLMMTRYDRRTGNEQAGRKHMSVTILSMTSICAQVCVPSWVPTFEWVTVSGSYVRESARAAVSGL